MNFKSVFKRKINWGFPKFILGSWKRILVASAAILLFSAAIGINFIIPTLVIMSGYEKSAFENSFVSITDSYTNDNYNEPTNNSTRNIIKMFSADEYGKHQASYLEGIDTYDNYRNYHVEISNMYEESSSNIYDNNDKTHKNLFTIMNTDNSHDTTSNTCFSLIVNGDESYVREIINTQSSYIENEYNDGKIFDISGDVHYGDYLKEKKFRAFPEEYFGIYTRCSNYSISYSKATYIPDMDYTDPVTLIICMFVFTMSIMLVFVGGIIMQVLHSEYKQKNGLLKTKQSDDQSDDTDYNDSNDSDHANSSDEESDNTDTNDTVINVMENLGDVRLNPVSLD